MSFDASATCPPGSDMEGVQHQTWNMGSNQQKWVLTNRKLDLTNRNGDLTNRNCDWPTDMVLSTKTVFWSTKTLIPYPKKIGIYHTRIRIQPWNAWCRLASKNRHLLNDGWWYQALWTVEISWCQKWYSTASGWWFQSLWKILVGWDYCSQYMENIGKPHVPNQQPGIILSKMYLGKSQ